MFGDDFADEKWDRAFEEEDERLAVIEQAQREAADAADNGGPEG